MRMRAPGRLVRRLLAMALVPATLSGCVVVSDPEFQGQDECDPFFLTQEADPSTSGFVRLTETTPDSDVFRASVPMRSCALTKNYTLNVFVDKNLRAQTTIFPTERDLRNVPIVVDVFPERANPGCHRVEAFVSTGFTSDFRTAARPGDVAKITWWFFNDADAPVTSCEGL